MQNLISKVFDGPTGQQATFFFRPDTADENTILATYHEDEYRFQDMPPAKGDWMIDAGGYVGSTAILYAQLYPDAHVLCIEPLPENLEIIRKNVEANGLNARITVLDRALWQNSIDKIKVFYRDESVVGKVHKFVGSAFPDYHETVSQEGAEVMTIDLDMVVELYNIEHIRLLKMDIEGAEYKALYLPTVGILEKIQTMVGEYHNVDPKNCTDPRTKLYKMVEAMFEDKSKEPERPTWGAFLFERRG